MVRTAGMRREERRANMPARKFRSSANACAALVLRSYMAAGVGLAQFVLFPKRIHVGTRFNYARVVIYF